MYIAGKKYSKRIFSWGILVLSTVWLCLVASSAFPLTLEEERELGREFMAKIRKQFDFVKDDFVNEYVNDLGKYLIEPLETKYFPFDFFVVKNAGLNAFAAPGGHIFIFSGLIEAIDGADELAAVMCHEIAHVSARHLAERIEQSKKIGLGTLAGVLAGALIGGQAGGAVIAGSAAAGIQTQLHYSRNDERQADQLGFKYMKQAGFDPSAMINALNKIGRANLGGSKIPAYLLTHPSGPERLASLDTMLSGYTPGPENKEAASFRALFPYLQTVLTVSVMAPQEAEVVFQRELEENPDSTQAQFGLGLVWKARAEYDLAIEHLEKALQKDPASKLVRRHLVETYQLDGREPEAVSDTGTAAKKDDREDSDLLALAKSYQDQEDYAKAIPIYEKLAAIPPVKNEVFYHLGVSYGKVGKLALAHYNLGIFYRRMGDAEKAAFHFRKASDLASGDPSLRERIQRAAEGLSSKSSRPASSR